MTKEEIKQAAKEYDRTAYCGHFAGEEPSFHYYQGATMVNERQPYSAEDMIAFGEQCKGIPQWVSVCDELLKLWEETKNG